MSDSIQYCDGCKHLNIDEQQQALRIREVGAFWYHWCHKYNERVYHRGKHPHIVPSAVCMQAQGFEQKEGDCSP